MDSSPAESDAAAAGFSALQMAGTARESRMTVRADRIVRGSDMPAQIIRGILFALVERR